MSEFSGYLYILVAVYLIYRFGRMLWVNGRLWVLKTFCLSILLVMAAVILHDLAEHISNPGLSLFASSVFLVGAYVFEAELTEIKNHLLQFGIYASIVAAAGVLTML